MANRDVEGLVDEVERIKAERNAARAEVRRLREGIARHRYVLRGSDPTSKIGMDEDRTLWSLVEEDADG
jgi:hypothetical protein